MINIACICARRNKVSNHNRQQKKSMQLFLSLCVCMCVCVCVCVCVCESRSLYSWSLQHLILSSMPGSYHKGCKVEMTPTLPVWVVSGASVQRFL